MPVGFPSSLIDPYAPVGFSWMVKVKPSIVESSFSMSTRNPSYLRQKQWWSIVARFLKSPLPTAEVVVGHDEGLVGDRGDLDFGAPEACLPQCHGQQYEKKRQPRHNSEIWKEI